MSSNKLPGTHDRRNFLGIAAASATALASRPVLAASGRQSRKKGFCNVVRGDRQWLKNIQALEASWFYSWGAKKPADVPAEIEFVPMIWGAGKNLAATLKDIEGLRKKNEIRHLMGFNEPDQPEQSNIKVERALEIWPQLMEIRVPLASPGCVHPDRQWMIDFMQGVQRQRLRVDFVCVHSYGGTNAGALLSRLQRVYQMFGRPLWITEFAVGDWQAKSIKENRHRPQQVAQFMREVLPLLEQARFVHRYAWFSAKPDNRALGTSALLDASGKLTELGKIYRSV